MKGFILVDVLAQVQNGYTLCGIVDRKGRVYPLGSDTKVISTFFEIITKRAVADYAKSAGLILVEPEKQNHYLDFTLMRHEEDQEKIAIDVKTTYRKREQSRFNYTMGSYTSYIRSETESKNIVFPYSQYREHWVIGFVYRRIEGKRELGDTIYSFSSLHNIPIPFEDVEVFMQEKWRIAGDKAGSGNTTNIGSINGTISDFVDGRGIFKSEDEFLEYWRGYKLTATGRRNTYSNIQEFKRIRQQRPIGE